MASVFDPGSDHCAIWTAPVEERVAQHRGALRACARRLLGDDAEADAVVAEVLAAAPRAFALFRPFGSLGAWLQGVTVGASLARLAARQGRQRGPLRQLPARIAAAS